MWHETKKILQEHQNFILTTHVNPDGDGLGAACALTEFLLQRGKKVRFVCDSPLPRKFAFLDYHGLFEAYDPKGDYSQMEVLIALDAHKRERLGALARFIDIPGVVSLCIDHHEIEIPCTTHCVMDPKACSAGAMIYSLLCECDFQFNLEAATGIYASVICDTGRFCYSSTSLQAHHIAEECMKVGVDPDLMYARLFQHVSLAEARLFAHVLLAMETYHDDQVVIQQISSDDYAKMNINGVDLEHIDFEYIHDFNHMIEGVRCFVLLREIDGGHVRVSLRSKRNLDMSSMVHQLGGGGHANAAGILWRGSLLEIKQKILNLLDGLFENEKNRMVASEMYTESDSKVSISSAPKPRGSNIASGPILT